jgi:hypothetical protein
LDISFYNLFKKGLIAFLELLFYVLLLELFLAVAELNKQYITVKKTTPRCRHKNDSVKNKLIIRNAKAK